MTKVARRHRKRKRQTKKQGEASRQKDIEKERRTERMKMYGWAQTVTGRCIGGGRVIREACKVLRDKTSPH